MNYEDLIVTILSGVVALCIIGLFVYFFIRYGTKYCELEYKCKNAELHFYESASKLIDKDLKDNANELSN